jgi:hypothetical protein
VAHTCNPNYSGGRDQEDHDLKPALQIAPKTLSQKTGHQKKRTGRAAQGAGPKFKLQYHKTKERKSFPQ